MAQYFVARGAAVAINNSGQVVGSPLGDYFMGYPYLWQNGVATQLSGMDAALAINDSGEVAGCSTTDSTGRGSACVWQNGVVTDLPGGGEAFAINNSGEVAGYDSASNACVWQNGVLTELPGGSGAMARAINDSGEVAGSCGAYPDNHACVWQNGVLTALPGYDGLQSVANGINSSGQVVGCCYNTTTGQYEACLWQNGGVTDLGPGGALGINNNGWIVGYSMDGNGNSYAVLWQPVPEPSSVFTLVCGTVGVLGLRKKRGVNDDLLRLREPES